jgi:anthranilate phosphoribosyltransferase
MTYVDLVQPLLERRDLSPEQATSLMQYLVSGEATEAQIGGALIGLRMKGCTTRELAAFASVLRAKAASLGHSFDDLVDTCGTGGGIPSFNLSTAAAIVAAAAGVRVAKHGNRAVTSRCGSADVLEHLGLRIGGDSESLIHILEAVGLVFLFAPAHHPAMRHLGKARRELGVRTVFNQLGPLANPAGAKRQLIGVYEVGLMRSMGEALRELGTDRALIVHGKDGLDEISPVTGTEYVKVWDGRVSSGTLTPADFGLEPLDPSVLEPGEDVAENARILREAITDADSPRAAAVLPNAAATIWIAGIENDLKSAVERARMVIQTGRAAEKLEQLLLVGGNE